MYFYKYLTHIYYNLLFCAFSHESEWAWSEPTEAQSTEESPITNKKDIEDKSKKLGIDVQKIRDDLQSLKNENLSEKAEDMMKKVLELKEFEKHVGKKITILETWLSLLEQKEQAGGNESIFEDATEIEKIRETILSNKREYNEYIEESSAMKRTLETLSQNKFSQEEIEKYKTLTNKEFLGVSPESRLRFVTVWNISSEMVSAWDVKNIEFTFTYDGTYNRDLYIRTTAGQVLPDEIREVTSGDEVFVRKWIKWEFFTAEGKRLKIHEGTKIDVSKTASSEELSALEQQYQEQLKSFDNPAEKQIALWALKRWIDPKFAILNYGEALWKIPEDTRAIDIEDKMTEIARFMDDFSQDYPWKDAFEGEKVSEAFAGYVVGILNGDVQSVAKTYGFDAAKMKTYRKQEKYSSGWPLNMENVNVEGVPQEEINSILKRKRFTPWSREAQVLFTVAAQSAWLPDDWGKNPWLHRILSKESNGVVGRLNYTIPKSYTPEKFKQIALARRNNNPIGVRSTASWLWQLLLSNVDKYYPDGRKGLWDPLNEAVGMLRYIHDRYKTVETAGALYGRTGTHNGISKTFKEWY